MIFDSCFESGYKLIISEDEKEYRMAFKNKSYLFYLGEVIRFVFNMSEWDCG